jgi:large subunit ribosomal protein L15
MSMLHEITGSVPRYKKRIRKGRGKATGRGKTSGRGTKGSGAHGGDVHWTPGNEGGQTPFFRRVPKRGFSNFKFRLEYHVINLDAFDKFADGATVDQAALVAAGLVPDDRQPLKVLGDGEISKKVTVLAAAYSKSALAKIQAAGGVTQDVKGEAYVPTKPKKKVDPAKQWERKQQQKAGTKRPAAAAAAEPAAPAAEEAK